MLAFIYKSIVNIQFILLQEFFIKLLKKFLKSIYGQIIILWIEQVTNINHKLYIKVIYFLVQISHTKKVINNSFFFMFKVKLRHISRNKRSSGVY